MSLAHVGKSVFIIIATDGLPTDLSGDTSENAKRETVAELRKLCSEWRAQIVVRLCTSEDEVVEFWNDVDALPELLIDVIDDFESEAREMKKSGNGWLTYSPSLHAIREGGTHLGLLDGLDERRLMGGEAACLAALLVDQNHAGGGPLPDPYVRGGAEAFARVVASRVGTCYDPLKRAYAPTVDARGLARAVAAGGGGMGSNNGQPSCCVVS